MDRTEPARGGQAAEGRGGPALLGGRRRRRVRNRPGASRVEGRGRLDQILHGPFQPRTSEDEHQCSNIRGFGKDELPFGGLANPLGRQLGIRGRDPLLHERLMPLRDVAQLDCKSRMGSLSEIHPGDGLENEVENQGKESCEYQEQNSGHAWGHRREGVAREGFGLTPKKCRGSLMLPSGLQRLRPAPLTEGPHP